MDVFEIRGVQLNFSAGLKFEELVEQQRKLPKGLLTRRCSGGRDNYLAVRASKPGDESRGERAEETIFGNELTRGAERKGIAAHGCHMPEFSHRGHRGSSSFS